MKLNLQLFVAIAASNVLCALLLFPTASTQNMGNMSPASTMSGAATMQSTGQADTSLEEKNFNSTFSGLAANSAMSSPPSTTATPIGGLLSKVKDIIKVGKSSTTTTAPILSGGQPLQQQQQGGQQQLELGGGGSEKKKEGFLAKVNDLFSKKDKDSEKNETSLSGQNNNDRSFIKKQYTEHEQVTRQQASGQAEVNKPSKDSQQSSSIDSPELQGASRDGAIEGLTSIVKKGTDAVREKIHMIEDKARQKSDQLGRKFDETIRKPMANISGSGTAPHEGKAYEYRPEEPPKISNSGGRIGEQVNSTVSASASVSGANAYQQTVGSALATDQAYTIKDLVKQAKSRGIIPPYDPKNYIESDSSLVVDVLDKAHELSKFPAENLFRPIDKLFGYEKNPFLRVFDNTFDAMRAPLKTIAKPVDKVVSGAFKTVDESKKETQEHLMEKSEYERSEIKKEEDNSKERSITGDIVDKVFELYTKPLEILLRPIDHFLGQKQNPFLHKVHSLYDLTKQPVDALIKPLENILIEMAEAEELLKFNNNYDPKLVTRLADGSMNIFDRIVSAPMEFILDPLNFALGFNEPGKKNPIIQAAHQLKNSSLRGIELFTRPVDRIIKDIADIGDKNKSTRDRELERIRQIQRSTKIVKKLERIHQALQVPVEIWLKPVSMAMGVPADEKLPVLRAWDLMHELLKRPLQVVSKPIEDLLTGNAASGTKKPLDWNKVDLPKEKKGGKEFESAISAPAFREERTNVITDSIRKIEMLAARPVKFLTSPIRRLIMAGDSEASKMQDTKYSQNPEQDTAFSPALDDDSHDKILTTFDKLNNVVLRPIELLTQPVSNFLSDGQKSESEKSAGGKLSEPNSQQQQKADQQQQGRQ